MNQEPHLFTQGDLRATIDNIRNKLIAEVSSLSLSQVTPPDCEMTKNYLVSSYTLEPVEILTEGIEAVELGEKEIQAKNHWGETYRQKKVELRVEMPFRGHGSLLLQLRPSSYDLNPPRGKVGRDKVSRILHAGPSDGQSIAQEIERWKNSVIRYITSQRPELDQWNNGLPAQVDVFLAQRRSKLEADQNMLGNIGIPIRKRDDPPKAYVVPVNQVVVAPKLPATKQDGATAQSPVLDMKVYDDILDTLASMSITMERCPSAFHGLGEEDLRMQFLIPLNSKYKGETSGETFNKSGKTDILIKRDDRILFVAECKFWKGPQSLTNTIDQLLGYLTWRETKAAILLFNKQKGFSSVLAKIPDVFRQHPSFVREEKYESETGFRFVIQNPSDKERHLLVTLLAFDVPTEK